MQVNINLIKGYLGFVVEREFCIVERKIKGFVSERQRGECDKERGGGDRVSLGGGGSGLVFLNNILKFMFILESYLSKLK